MGNARTLTAQEALQILGVRRETLYAYVSRGKIRSERDEANPRARRYVAEDVEKLGSLKSIRSSPGEAGSQVLQYGMPILKSRISRITDQDVFLRDQPLSELARSASFEEVCGLLWLGQKEKGSPLFDQIQTPRLPESIQVAMGAINTGPLDKFQSMLPFLQTTDLGVHNRTPVGVSECGVRIVRFLSSLLAGDFPPADKPMAIADVLAQSLCTHKTARAEQHRVLNAMLVLCAEHELNASSFTARCAASAGASPYATVNAGMCALRGPKHAGATLAVEELLEAVAKSGDATAVVTHYLAQGRSVPGFGHRVYRDLDPRAAILFEMIESLPGGSKEMRRVSQLIHTMALGTGLKANLDLALVACSRALGAPASTSLHIFCLARVAGFIAHTIEQYQDGRLLRPRAEFER